MQTFRKLTGFGLFLGVLPVLCVILASFIAGAGSCQVNEGGVNPCMIAGYDVGGVLYGMFMMGWMALFTVPLAALLIVFWIAAEGVNAVRNRGS